MRFNIRHLFVLVAIVAIAITGYDLRRTWLNKFSLTAIAIDHEVAPDGADIQHRDGRWNVHITRPDKAKFVSSTFELIARVRNRRSMECSFALPLYVHIDPIHKQGPLLDASTTEITPGKAQS